MGKHNNRYDKHKGVSEKVSTKLSKRLDEKSMSETLSISCMKNPVEYASKHANKKLRLKGISKAEKKLLTCGCEHVIINKKGRRKAALRPAEKGMMQCRLCGKIISPTIPTEEDLDKIWEASDAVDNQLRLMVGMLDLGANVDRATYAFAWRQKMWRKFEAKIIKLGAKNQVIQDKKHGKGNNDNDGSGVAGEWY